MKVYIDIETRSLADIKFTGARLYAEHPSTDILCIAYAIDDHPVTVLDMSTGMAELRALAQDPHTTFVAHNAAFEQAIWESILVRRYRFRYLDPPRWRCTYAKALAHGLPGGLEEVGIALKLSVQKDADGNKIMQELSRPRRNSTAFIAPIDAPEKFAALYEYCKTDVLTTRLVDKALRDLSQQEQTLWEIDQRINQEGIYVDINTIQKAIAISTAHADEARRAFVAATGGELDSPTKRAKLITWLTSHGIQITNTQKSTIDRLLANADLPYIVRVALESMSGITKTSLAKLPNMLRRADTCGRVREILTYHAAHTGRWGGRGVQIQNMKRPTLNVDHVIQALNYDYTTVRLLYKDPAEAISSSLRAMIIPSSGNKFLVGDFAQIEARVLAWLAGQHDTLDLFAAGEDLYCAEASKIYGRTIVKTMKTERQVGKVAVLALGYQGGIAAFAEMAKAYDVDLQPVFNSLWSAATPQERRDAEHSYMLYLKKADDPVSKQVAFVADIIKQRWRRGNAAIVEYWNLLENAAIAAVRTKHPVPYKNTTWFLHDRFLFCKLPSGRCMAYPYPRVSETKNGKFTLSYISAQEGRISTYGGKIAENLTQAVSRDLLADAILRLEREYPVTFHVHDEIISEVGETENALSGFLEIMRESPSWAAGLPIDVSGWDGRRYGKE